MAKRQVFYSFHYENDAWRAGQVRNIGVLEGNFPVFYFLIFSKGIKKATQ